MKTKLPKLRPTEHAALLQYRENLEGGDPNMSAVSGVTARTLEAKGLIAKCVYDAPVVDDGRYAPEVKRVFARASIPTRLGLAVLDAMTHGPKELPR